MLRSARSTRRLRRIDTGVPDRPLVYVRMRAAPWLCTLPQRTYIRIGHTPAPILPACSATASLTVLFARLAYIPGRGSIATGTSADY